ncbi:MAG: PHP domain-containing protein, partial [Eubacteriales bacterium]
MMKQPTEPFLAANYHTHTPRCGHAGGNEREYIENAIRAGIRTLGFADHAPYPFPKSYRSGMRMEVEETEAYT